MSARAQAFLATLSAEQRATASISYDDPARLDWHNIPKPTRKGVQLRDLSPEQRSAALALMHTGLSDVGYEKSLRIMSLETNLHEGEKHLKGSPLRDPERYFFTVFGDPVGSAPWGWSCEGHHLSLNYVVCDGRVVSDTPMFLGANPATVKTFVAGGPEIGVRTLSDEEQRAFDLVNSLDEQQRRQAIIDATAPKDYRAAGQPQPPREPPAGIAASALGEAQRKILWSLIESHCNNLPAPLREARLEAIRANGGIDRVFFAWAGATKPGVGHYFRVEGPTFVVELVNIQSDPAGNPANHIHSVWRDPRGDFGISP